MAEYTIPNIHARCKSDWNRNRAIVAYYVEQRWRHHHCQQSDQPLRLLFVWCFDLTTKTKSKWIGLSYTNVFYNVAYINSTHSWNVNVFCCNFAATSFLLKFRWMFGYFSASIIRQQNTSNKCEPSVWNCKGMRSPNEVPQVRYRHMKQNQIILRTSRRTIFLKN